MDSEIEIVYFKSRRILWRDVMSIWLYESNAFEISYNTQYNNNPRIWQSVKSQYEELHGVNHQRCIVKLWIGSVYLWKKINKFVKTGTENTKFYFDSL